MQVISKILFTLIAASFFASAYAECQQSFITHLDIDKAELTLANGSTWEIDAVGQLDFHHWQVGDEILACNGHYLIRKENGKKVNATITN